MIGLLTRLLNGGSVAVQVDAVPEALAHSVTVACKVAKLAPAQQIAYGWASVIEVDGLPVIDHDNEVITEADLDAFVLEFVLARHGGKVMHEGEIESELVESMMFTKEKQAVLGIDLGKVGWWIGMKYRRPEVWARIESGELPQFSIAGYARPQPVPNPEEP